MEQAIDFFLNKFRKCHSLDSVERLFDKFSDELAGIDLAHMFSAADHRRAELTFDRLFERGKIPKEVWSFVK